MKRQLKPGFKIFIFFTRKSGFTEIISFVFPLQESPFSSLDVTSTHETGMAYIVIMRNEKENVESWSWWAAASLVVNLLQCQRRCYVLIWRTIFSMKFMLEMSNTIYRSKILLLCLDYRNWIPILVFVCYHHSIASLF